MPFSSDRNGRQRLALVKLTRPSLPKGYASRSRLMDAFGRTSHQQITCVVAPDGSGKTCAALEYANRLESDGCKFVSWLTIDRLDNNPVRFWLHLLAALELPFDDVMGGGAQCAIGEEEIVAASNALFDKLPSGESGYLFIDGFNFIEDEEVESSFIRFCKYAPPWFHVIITASSLSRRMDAEVYMFGQMQIGASDLAMTQDEACQMLAPFVEDGVSEKWLTSAYEMTEGWVQGLAMVGQTLSSQVHCGAMEGFNGKNRHVKRYFEGCVRSGLPGELTAFLYELSLFERFSRPLCDAAFENGKDQELVSEVFRRNLFVVPCDEGGEWYRFNPLFADWLRNEMLQLRIETIREICSRASEWFHDNGYDDEAAKYLLLASDFDYVENLTKATCSLSRPDSKKTDYLLWQCRIPSAGFAESPLLCMLSAWCYITNARVDDAQVWIARFEQSLQLEKNKGCLEPEVIEFSLKCLRMKCAAMARRGKEAIEQCDELLRSGYKIEPALLSMIYQSLGEAYERIGEMAQAQEIYLQAQASASVDATTHQLVFNAVSFAEVQYYFGELDEVQESCEKLLKTCPPNFAIYGFICALLARVLIEKNEAEQAVVFVRRALKRTSHYCHIDMYLEAKIAQAGYFVAVGDLPRAYEVIVEGVLQGERKDVPRGVLFAAYCSQAEIAAKRHNIRDLQIIERKFAARAEDDDVYYQLKLAFVRVLTKREQGDFASALSDLDSIIDSSFQRRFIGIAAKALVAKALVAKDLESTAVARSALGDLLLLANRHGFVRTLLDAGEPLRDLVRDYATSRKGSNVVKTYAKSLLLAFEKEALHDPRNFSEQEVMTVGAVNPLTLREQEILRLLNMGMSRLEISNELCISVNTVKKHLANIYDKLEVDTREEALKKLSFR